MLLAQENRRTVTAELTLAVECYLERAVRGSLRWHELAGEREATALAQELRQVRRDLTGEEPK